MLTDVVPEIQHHCTYVSLSVLHMETPLCHCSFFSYSGTEQLQVASFHDHHECVKYILKQGANVNAIDDDGSTALQNAAYNGSTESLKVCS